MTKLSTIAMEKVMTVINNGATTFINDHNDKVEKMVGYIILDNEHVCPVIDNPIGFCLNPLYMDENKEVCLSRASVGGSINVGRHGSLERAIEAYKKDAEESEFGFNKKITDYKLF